MVADSPSVAQDLMMNIGVGKCFSMEGLPFF